MGIPKRRMPYGVAKKAAMVMLDAYQRQYGLSGAYLLPVNLYGPWDNFDLHTSHVIPALIRKCVEARDSGQDHIECWGTGSASREFLYVEDAAEGVVRATEVLDEPVPVNLGTNMEITIKDLVELIVKLTNFQGEIRWDSTKPDGQPRRCLDVSRAAERLDWQAQVGFEDGLRAPLLGTKSIGTPWFLAAVERKESALRFDDQPGLLPRCRGDSATRARLEPFIGGLWDMRYRSLRLERCMDKKVRHFRRTKRSTESRFTALAAAFLANHPSWPDFLILAISTLRQR